MASEPVAGDVGLKNSLTPVYERYPQIPVVEEQVALFVVIHAPRLFSVRAFYGQCSREVVQ